MSNTTPDDLNIRLHVAGLRGDLCSKHVWAWKIQTLVFELSVKRG
jgi:hypothetical protein